MMTDWQKMLLEMQRMTRQVARELAMVENPASTDLQHINKASQLLLEQSNMIVQLKEELSQYDFSEATGAKRQRGGGRRYYLREEYMEKFTSFVSYLFEHYYIGGCKFRLDEKHNVKAPLFLACLYDLGIKLQFTTADAAVSDFADIVLGIAKTYKSASDLTTAYNTINKVLISWRECVKHGSAHDHDIHLHTINKKDVIEDQLKYYEKSIYVLLWLEREFRKSVR